MSLSRSRSKSPNPGLEMITTSKSAPVVPQVQATVVGAHLQPGGRENMVGKEARAKGASTGDGKGLSGVDTKKASAADMKKTAAGSHASHAHNHTHAISDEDEVYTTPTISKGTSVTEPQPTTTTTTTANNRLPHQRVLSDGTGTAARSSLRQRFNSTYGGHDPQQTLDRVADSMERREASAGARIQKHFAAASEQIAGAQEALETTMNDPAAEAGRMIIRQLLAPAKEVAALLDVVSEIHPAVAAVAGIFKVVIQMELDHNENHAKVAVLHFSLTDMLFSLGYLKPAFSKEDELSQKLDHFLRGVEKTINEFGNFCDVYYKQRSFVRFLKSGSYKEKLSEFATKFEDQKRKLKQLLALKTASTISQVDESMGQMHAKVDDIMKFIATQKSAQEADVEKSVLVLGGEEEVLKDATKIEKLAQKYGEQLAANVMFTLYASIEHLMEGNVNLFTLKVETASAEIKDAIERSTNAILLRIDSGPHELIENNEIRSVWKEMQWRISCKCRHFVDAIHHHYFRLFSRHKALTGENHPCQWTLFFLSNVLFYPAIGEAIDDDGSGFVSVYEVNKFLRAIPEGWSTPQWLAFWAAGWYQNAIVYSTRCDELAKDIRRLAKTALPENRRALKPFLTRRDQGLSDLRLIYDSVMVDTLDYHGVSSRTEFDELLKLRKEYMEIETRAMMEQLERTKYQLDCIASVHAVMGTRRDERSVLCLMHLLLRHYKQIAQVAQTKVLDPQEFQAMSQSSFNLTEAFERRFNNLKESWRQQRLDTKLQVTYSAGGLFNFWYLEFYIEDYASDTESEWDGDTSIMPDLHDDAEVDPDDILVFGVPLQPGLKHRASMGTILTSPTTQSLTSSEDEEEEEEEEDDGAYHDHPRLKETTTKRLDRLEGRLMNIEKLLTSIAAAGTASPKGGRFRALPKV